MPYYGETTIAGVVQRVRKHFLHNEKYQVRAPEDRILLDMLNEALDEVYGNAFRVQDKQSFSTVADQWYYAISGATPATGVTDNIDEVLRVEYDGGIIDRYLFIDEIGTQTTDDESDTPTKWYEVWDGGIRYLHLKPTPDTADKTVTLYVTTWPDSLSATTSIPVVSKDFWSVLTYCLILAIYEWMEEFDKAEYWRVKRVDPGVRRIARAEKRRMGKQVKTRTAIGFHELMEGFDND